MKSVYGQEPVTEGLTSTTDLDSDEVATTLPFGEDNIEDNLPQKPSTPAQDTSCLIYGESVTKFTYYVYFYGTFRCVKN